MKLSLTDILMLPVDKEQTGIKQTRETEDENKAKTIAKMLNGEICLYCRTDLKQGERALCTKCKQTGKK